MAEGITRKQAPWEFRREEIHPKTLTGLVAIQLIWIVALNREIQILLLEKSIELMGRC